MTMIKVVITFQDLDESGFKSAVEDGVNDGVDGGGYVTKPETNVGQVIRHMTCWTCSEVDIKDEKRRPAYDESEEHETQNFRSFLLVGDGVGSQSVPLLSR